MSDPVYIITYENGVEEMLPAGQHVTVKDSWVKVHANGYHLGDPLRMIPARRIQEIIRSEA